MLFRIRERCTAFFRGSWRRGTLETPKQTLLTTERNEAKMSRTVTTEKKHPAQVFSLLICTGWYAKMSNGTAAQRVTSSLDSIDAHRVLCR